LAAPIVLRFFLCLDDQLSPLQLPFQSRDLTLLVGQLGRELLSCCLCTGLGGGSPLRQGPGPLFELLSCCLCTGLGGGSPLRQGPGPLFTPLRGR